MSADDEPIGMPRVLLAIRLGLFAFFALGITLVVLADSASQPWLYGACFALAILFGVLSLLLYVLPLVNGSYVEEIPAAEGQTGYRGSIEAGGGFDGGGEGD